MSRWKGYLQSAMLEGLNCRSTSKPFCDHKTKTMNPFMQGVPPQPQGSMYMAGCKLSGEHDMTEIDQLLVSDQLMSLLEKRQLMTHGIYILFVTAWFSRSYLWKMLGLAQFLTIGHLQTCHYLK